MAIEVISEVQALSDDALVAELAKRNALGKALSIATPDMIAAEITLRAVAVAEGANHLLADMAKLGDDLFRDVVALDSLEKVAGRMSKRAGNAATAVLAMVDHNSEHPLARSALTASRVAGVVHSRCCALLERARLIASSRRAVARG